MKRLTREWVLKAEKDWALAKMVAEAPPKRREVFHDQTCFLCQQAAEKYLKALMQELDLSVPRTHDLDALLDRLVPDDRALATLRRATMVLSPYAVEYRYPGIDATKRKARAALRHAEKVRAAVRDRLGLPTTVDPSGP